MTTRDELRQNGGAMRGRLGQPEKDGGGKAAGFEAMLTEAVYGGIWSRPGLPIEDRMTCTLAALSLTGNETQLRRFIAAALDLGMAPRSVVEIFVQCGLYGGFPAAQSAIDLADGVFAERGVTIADDPPSEDPLDVLEENGRRLLHELHGERGTQGYAAPGNAATGALYEMAIQYGYGELWHRPGLDRRGRMVCALAAFTVLGLEGQLRKFAQSARNVDIGDEEIIEAIMQTVPYGGFPRALNALGIVGGID